MLFLHSTLELSTKMASNKSGILYLFDRPSEPVYVPKGDNKVAFDIPPDYLVSNVFHINYYLNII